MNELDKCKVANIMLHETNSDREVFCLNKKGFLHPNETSGNHSLTIPEAYAVADNLLNYVKKQNLIMTVTVGRSTLVVNAQNDFEFIKQRWTVPAEIDYDVKPLADYIWKQYYEYHKLAKIWEA